MNHSAFNTFQSMRFIKFRTHWIECWFIEINQYPSKSIDCITNWFKHTLNWFRPLLNSPSHADSIGIQCIRINHRVVTILLLIWPFRKYEQWNMLITFTHAYISYWLANAIELCTKQTHNRVCVTNPLAVYKTARYSLILSTKMYVQFTCFMGRVYWNYPSL